MGSKLGPAANWKAAGWGAKWPLQLSRGSVLRCFCRIVFLSAVFAVPSLSSAQTASCAPDGNMTLCTVSGPESSVSFSSPGDFQSSAAVQVQSSATYDVSVNDSGDSYALSVNSAGSAGGATGGIALTNSGTVTAQQQGSTSPGYLYGLQVVELGGVGEGGGQSGATTVTNDGAVTISLPQSATVTGGAGIFASSTGGAGAAGTGGVGGVSLGASVTNNAAINASLYGSEGYAGIAAIAAGGAGGSGTTNDDSGNGGNVTGETAVMSAAPVNLTWSWQNTGATNLGVYGIIAESSGGDAPEDYRSDSGGAQYAGSGGNGGAAMAALMAGGDVTLNVSGAPPGGMPATPSAGIAASSIGGAGGPTDNGNDNNAGTGGDGTGATVDITDANVQTSTQQGSLAGVLAFSEGGAGGTVLGTNANPSQNGGGGGSAGDGSINITAQTEAVTISAATGGTDSPAIAADLVGGSGGAGGNSNDTGFSTSHGGDGGSGGNGGNATITLAGSENPITVTASGATSAGVYAGSIGGDGGLGANADTNADGSADGGDGGTAGSGGDIGLHFNNTSVSPGFTSHGLISITTNGTTSPGIFAQSAGGDGGASGMATTGVMGSAYAQGAGKGGSGSDITLDAYFTAIMTQAVTSPGIVAVSSGGNGGDGGDMTVATTGNGGDGGAGGNTGNVTVLLGTGSQIQTQGTDSSGILAETLSGAGGSGGTSNARTVGSAGKAGNGGTAGNVMVTSSGVISTQGGTARGILAQSLSGTGGAGGGAWGTFSDKGGSGGVATQAGNITVSNTGEITTAGSDAEGVLAQSIGGAGGAGGQASGPVSNVGGGGGSGASGGVVNFTETGGSIETSGVSGIGVLEQSVGGNGGDGGGASGGFITVGGSGGNAADTNGSVMASIAQGALIGTTGDEADGVVLQSIGGGGGNAGNATSASVFASVALGGTGGAGGNASTANATLNGATITTSGSKASGLVVQSIGGGGGTGGNAAAYAIGVGYSAAYALGGKGGAAGNADNATAAMVGGLILTGQDQWLENGFTGGSMPVCPGTSAGSTGQGCNTLAVDDYGVVVQSIGGGGGLGGSATAEAVTISPPSDAPESSSEAYAAAYGASGGDAGDGDTAQFALSDGGAIVTAGQGSTAVLAQSIGGGGGAGGDSSAMAAVIGYGANGSSKDNTSTGETISVTQGGAGGTGATGGAVNVALGGIFSGSGTSAAFMADPAGSAGTAIVTFGDYADGIKAQSIGGGGGDSGIGSGNTQGFGTSLSQSVTLTLGASGGTGADGGQVTVTLFAPPGADSVATAAGVLPVGITTYGSGADGVIAQSIGGGGGSSQGGSINVAQSMKLSDSQTFKPSFTISLGDKQGTSGGDGEAVTVTVDAPITTHGGNAVGLLAQSIGGGGGVGGSAGADASQDNPVIEALGYREFGSDVTGALTKELNNSGSFPQLDYTDTLLIGGTGGTGGVGGLVAVDVNSTITTAGDWAQGVLAQSVGGGGGDGGTSVASGTGGLPGEVTINANHAIGGNGGTGGDGGQTAVDLGQSNPGLAPASIAISTAGFGATGVVAQSIGGGGGAGADGSDSATGYVNVGSTANGSGGGGGDAMAAEIGTVNENGGGIATLGDFADGAVVQSIGGGGGIGGTGSTAWVENAAAWTALAQTAAEQSNTANPLSLSVGGGSSSSGTGSTATFDTSGGALNIITEGYGAFGVLAQSIGGGGGLLSATQTGVAANGAVGDSFSLGGTEDIGNTGDSSVLSANTVTVNLSSGSNIFTTGTDAFGVVAQSIGSGGGVLRMVGTDPDSAPSFSTSAGALGDLTIPDPGPGDGGDVNITTSSGSNVDVMGPGAIGIFAQSIGGGGGLIIGAVTGGQTGSSVTYAGSPGQSTASSKSGKAGNITLQLGGAVSAAGADGIGVFAQIAGSEDAGTATVNLTGSVTANGSNGVGIDADTPAGNNASQINIDGGTLEASDIAVEDTGGGSIVFNDNGNVTGSVLNTSTTQIESAGVLHPNGLIQAQQVINDGLLVLNTIGTTSVTGDYTQDADGRLGVTIDSLHHAASLLDVQGAASISGSIVPDILSLLPGKIEIVQAASLDKSDLALNSPVFDWNVVTYGDTITLSPDAKFTTTGFALTASESSFAAYLQKAWDNADADLAGQFAALAGMSDAGKFTTNLDNFSGKAAAAQSLALINNEGTILGAAMSCPEFSGAAMLITEDGCVWAKVTTQQSSQWATGDVQGYRVTSATYRLGGQQEIAPGWYVGGSVAAGQSWANTANGSSGNGQIYDGSVALKHIAGPWLFAGSIAFAGGSFDSNRSVNLPGVHTVLHSSPSAFLAGGRLRAGYEFAFDHWYLRPYGDVDLFYTNLPGFQESGLLPYALHVQGSSKVSVALSPMLEIGGRFDLNDGMILHPYAAFGGSFIPGNTRYMDASLAGADAADGSFRDDLQSPDAVANLQAGLRLYRGAHFDLTAEYDASLGGSFLSQSEIAKFAYHF